eukprot:2664379-Lingulodinium_polyedra.AAC.1
MQALARLLVWPSLPISERQRCSRGVQPDMRIWLGPPAFECVCVARPSLWASQPRATCCCS